MSQQELSEKLAHVANSVDNSKENLISMEFVLKKEQAVDQIVNGLVDLVSLQDTCTSPRIEVARAFVQTYCGVQATKVNWFEYDLHERFLKEQAERDAAYAAKKKLSAQASEVAATTPLLSPQELAELEKTIVRHVGPVFGATPASPTEEEKVLTSKPAQPVGFLDRILGFFRKDAKMQGA